MGLTGGGSAPRILTCGPLITGLNNQRICLVGLATIAEESGARIALPAEAVDFRPGEPNQTIALFDLFDAAAALAALGDLRADAPADEIIDMHVCFKAGNHALAGAKAGSRAAILLEALRPAALLRVAEEIAGALRRAVAAPDQLAAVQLRIESDWQRYLVKRGAAASDPEAMRALDPSVIFAKIRHTPALARVTTLYGCCDEDDLRIGRDALIGLARDHGFALRLKGMMMPDLDVPRISRAMIDYAVCGMMPAYIGLTKSTFSNNLRNASLWGNSATRHYSYDRAGTALLAR